MVDRYIDHIDADIGISGISVAVSAVRRISLRLFDLAFLNDFFILDHASSAVRTAVFSFLSRSAAARTVIIIFDLRSDDLLFRRV